MQLYEEVSPFQRWLVSLEVFPQYFLFPSWTDLSGCTKSLMENKFRSIWNSWVDRAWARVYLFSCCRRDRGRVDSEGICFVFCYRHHEGFLLQMVRNETNLKQLCARVSSQTAVFLPSNMFYNLLLWYSVLSAFLAYWKIFLLKGGEFCGCLTSILSLAVQPVLLGGSCERLRNAYHRMNPAHTDRWKERGFLWNNIWGKWNI